MNNEVLTINSFAKTIEDALRIHEESFDHDSAEKEEKESNFIDFNKFYTLSKFEAAKKACKENDISIKLAEVVYLLIKCCHNNINEWAETVLNYDTNISAWIY